MAEAGLEETVICPTCGVAIKASEVAMHADLELERLHKSLPAIEDEETHAGGSKARAEYERVRRNRLNRLRQRSRKRNASPAAPTHSTCPICNEVFAMDSIQQHANECLRRQRAQEKRRAAGNGVTPNGHVSDTSSDDGGADFEEYEWAGQSFVRASSMLAGGYAALSIGQMARYNRSQHTEDDEDLNVDQDDKLIYGPPQYSETDVIDGNSSDTRTVSYVRRLIAANERQTTVAQANGDEGDRPAAPSADIETSRKTAAQLATPSPTVGNAKLIVEALRAQLACYEQQSQPNKYK